MKRTSQDYTARELITLIVNSNSPAVKAMLKQITGINFDGFTDTALINYLDTMEKQGYNVSFLGDIKPVNAVKIDTGETILTIGGTPPTGSDTSKFEWGTFAAVLSAVLGTVAVATGAGNVLTDAQNPPRPTLPSTAPTAPKAGWEAFKEWVGLNPVMFGAIALSLVALTWFGFKKYGKK